MERRVSSPIRESQNRLVSIRSLLGRPSHPSQTRPVSFLGPGCCPSHPPQARAVFDRDIEDTRSFESLFSPGPVPGPGLSSAEYFDAAEGEPDDEADLS